MELHAGIFHLRDLRNKLSGRLHENDIREICSFVQSPTDDSKKKELYRLLFDADKRVADNAAWIFTHFDTSNNRWLHAKQDELIDEAMKTTSDTKRRLILALLLKQPFYEENIRIDFLDFCLSRMSSANDPIGVKALCMKLAYEQCQYFPELRSEFKAALEIMEPDLLPMALKTSRNNLLKTLFQIKSK